MDRNRSGYEAQGDEEDRMIPCTNYVNGFCVQGGKCRFYHPPSAQVPASIRCPPLPSEFGSPPVVVMRQTSMSPHFQHYGGSSHPPLHHIDFDPLHSRQTNCFFGQEPDVSMYTASGSDGSFERRLSRSPVVHDSSDDEGQRSYLPHGITATTKNGLVVYTYPNQYEPPVTLSRRSSESEVSGNETMFSHIKWNDFLIPGFAPPPKTDVPLQDINEKLLDDCERPKHSDQNSDTPPEGSAAERATRVKEEFRTKIKLLALEVLKEKANQKIDTLGQVRSLDSFFRNYDKIDTLPAQMLERQPNHILSSRRTSDLHNLPDLPELEEGELDESDHE